MRAACVAILHEIGPVATRRGRPADIAAGVASVSEHAVAERMVNGRELSEHGRRSRRPRQTANGAAAGQQLCMEWAEYRASVATGQPGTLAECGCWPGSAHDWWTRRARAVHSGLHASPTTACSHASQSPLRAAPRSSAQHCALSQPARHSSYDLARSLANICCRPSILELLASAEHTLATSSLIAFSPLRCCQR